MTPHQVLLVAAIGGATGVLGVLALAALSYGAGVTACKAFDYLFEKRQQRQQRRAEIATFSATLRAIHALPTTTHPRDDR